MNKKLRTGTWNVLTLYKGGTLKQLEKVLQDYKVDIINTTGNSLDWIKSFGEEELQWCTAAEKINMNLDPDL
jgi:hypothetical protein